MKLLCIIVSLNVLPVEGQPGTNLGSFAPIRSLDAARAKFPLGDFRRIAPNTPAFEEYGVNFMFTQANGVREKWKLDLPALTINDVYFQLKATAFGIDGVIETRDGRFLWLFTRSWLTQFQDHRYWPRSFRYKDDESARLAKIKSKISAKQAEQIARDALHALGLSEKDLRLVEPPFVNQFKFQETDGTTYPLPIFEVAWDIVGWPDENGVKALRFEVSGITRRVAQYLNFDPHRPNLPLPTNYFTMLNLPTNYLQTLPAPKRALWGLPPATATNDAAENDAAIQFLEKHMGYATNAVHTNPAVKPRSPFE